MPEYDRIDISEGTDINKTNLSKECHIFVIGFKYKKYLCNGCQDLMQKAMSFNNLLLFMLKEMITELIFGI